MRVRKEAVLLALTAAVLGFGFYRLGGEPPPLRGSARRESPDMVHHRVPDLSRVLVPEAGDGEHPRDADRAAPRDLFVEPSDTSPLPPLAWEEPPMRELPAVSPPPVPGPEPARYGPFLRGAVPHRATDLFAAGASLADVEDAGDPLADLLDRETTGEEVRQALDELGRRRSHERAPESPDERAARLESYRRLYDWVQLDTFATIFGTIENPDRYGLFLDGRDEEPIALAEVDPETGREKLPGQPPIPYPRERVLDFGLARTRANEIELRYRAIGGRITPGTFAQVLAFAREALDARHDAPRGLEIAEELFERLAAEQPEDPAPLVGRARCFEARFDLDAAFGLHRELIERFPHRPEVHVAFAELEERCLLFDSAVARLREAVRVDRASWLAHWKLGRALLARGDAEAAREHLATANRFAPEDAGYLTTRVAMRRDLGRALLRRGAVTEAAAQLELARALDPLHQETLAALVSCAVLDPGVAPDFATADSGSAGAEEAMREWLAPVEAAARGASETGESRGLRFDLLLALGLWDLEHDDHARALERLESAAASDPLRAPLAWRALSFLAEVTGYPDEAVRYVELALDGDPTDPWSHYQRGRLLARDGDLEDAIAAFESALELDLDFDDALVALGEVLFLAGRYDDAARYLERATEREPERPEVLALAGLNGLRRGTVHAAREAFTAALAFDRGDPVALGGLAWCTYRSGDPEEALIRLAELDDARRQLPADDPYRVWAREQAARLTDHLEKVEWRDGFERLVLRNGWQTDEGAGPLVELADGEVRIAGAFDRSGRVRLFREYPASQFVSVEASVLVPDGSRVRTGLFVARERRQGREWRIQGEAAVSRHKDGALEVTLARGDGGAELVQTDDVAFPAGRWVRLRIERTGPPERPTVDLYLDGIPIVRDEPFAELGRAAQPVRVGVFAEGETGRRAELRVDDARVVYREAAE